MPSATSLEIRSNRFLWPTPPRVGGVRVRSTLALVRPRLRGDGVHRDAAAAGSRHTPRLAPLHGRFFASPWSPPWPRKRTWMCCERFLLVALIAIRRDEV